MAATETSALLFVYNADSGAWNALMDAGHKLFSPATYACDLCAVTHSPLRMKPEWRRFLDELDLPVEFLHRDEFATDPRKISAELPAVFRADARGDLEVLLGRDRLATFQDLSALMTAIRDCL